MAIAHVPVSVNPKTRDSRLFTSIPGFIGRQLSSMTRMYAMYEPLRVFFCIGLVLSIIGVLMIIGFVTFMIGLVADLVSFNRQLTEITLEKIRRIELQQNEGVDD